MKDKPKLILTKIFDLVLPRFCCSCKTKLSPSENTLCDVCQSKIQVALPERLKREFDRKFCNNKIINNFFTPYVFEKDKELQNAIHSLKYENKFQVGTYLGQLLGKKLIQNNFQWKLDLIIPIPLHALKKAERGYNQSFYIAKGISKVLKINFSNKIVKRIKYTESQTTMTLFERENNINGAFKVTNSSKVSGKNILLIDDVITTGATVSECGKILLESGARNIYAASIAIAD